MIKEFLEIVLMASVIVWVLTPLYYTSNYIDADLDLCATAKTACYSNNDLKVCVHGEDIIAVMYNKELNN